MANPAKSDNWDWPYILYVGRVWLHYTDAETLSLTPRMFAAQLAVHKDIQERLHGLSSSAPQDSFIDQIPGW